MSHRVLLAVLIGGAMLAASVILLGIAVAADVRGDTASWPIPVIGGMTLIGALFVFVASTNAPDR